MSVSVASIVVPIDHQSIKQMGDMAIWGNGYISIKHHIRHIKERSCRAPGFLITFPINFQIFVQKYQLGFIVRCLGNVLQYHY